MFAHTAPEHFVHLRNDVFTATEDVLLFNIGSQCEQKPSHQEFPPFLNQLAKTFRIFNIDGHYEHDPANHKYCVELDWTMLAQIINYSLKKRKCQVIIFDNTCQTGLGITHSLALANIDRIGHHLEVIIGYGSHGDDAIIPIMHLSQEFYRKAESNAATQLKKLASLYCNECQTLHRCRESFTHKIAVMNQITTAETPLTTEKPNDFFIHHPTVRDFVKSTASAQGINICFTLDELAVLPLFMSAAPSLGLTYK